MSEPWRDPSAKPFIRIKDVTKRFGLVTAVNSVSLDIYQGELFCLLGGSGSGKSTLLRMLAGFENPTAGAIEIDGEDMASVPAYDRPTNMMFQSYALFPHMSVEKNVAYGLKRDGVSKSETADRVSEILKLVQLDGYQKRKPDQLSGGQRQRVALARALVKRPKLLLLDEPLGALDKKLREETQFELVNIQESLGVTFIVVTHDQEEAMTLATRIGVMSDGQIVQVAEPRDIYEYPVNRFVADFVGSVNMFEGTYAREETDRIFIKSDEFGGEIADTHGASCSIGQTVWYALRPEKIALSRKKPKSADNVVEGTVDEIAYMGVQSIYRIVLASGKTVKVTRTNRERGEGTPITWEEKVYLSWDAEAGVVLLG